MGNKSPVVKDYICDHCHGHFTIRCHSKPKGDIMHCDKCSVVLREKMDPITRVCRLCGRTVTIFSSKDNTVFDKCDKCANLVRKDYKTMEVTGLDGQQIWKMIVPKAQSRAIVDKVRVENLKIRVDGTKSDRGPNHHGDNRMNADLRDPDER